jgi:hypothetical protein
MKAILLILSIIILSQGYGFVYGEDSVVTVTTNSSSYEDGEIINISGFIFDYQESDQKF